MYRAIGLKALRHNPKLDNRSQIASIARNSVIGLIDSPGGSRVCLHGEDVSPAIRAEQVSQAASIVSGISDVRGVLVQPQQQRGANRDVVLEGRDIGTKVSPNANLKI